MTHKTMEDTKILLVEDDSALGELLREEVEDSGFNARLANTAEAALSTIESWHPELVITDLRLPGADGLALLQETRRKLPQVSADFLVITAFGSVAKAVECLKAGAEDFLTKPLDLEHFRLSIERIIEKRRLQNEVRQMKSLMKNEDTFHNMYGRSRPMRALFQQIRQVAQAEGPVLITGESGTGKELVAKAIHQESTKAKGPFLAVNCAGIPENLLESEFFGHEAGAFTGAGNTRRGLFAEATGGTLLLDEISEMPMALQAKLLRVLQDGMIRPVGANQEQKVDVRILTATNRNLEKCVQDKAFREDLFFRLETFQLSVPPLSEREDDIDLLAAFFLQKHMLAAGKHIRGFTLQAQELLHSHAFPGNVRELQNAIERAVAFCTDKEIGVEHLPPRLQKKQMKKKQQNEGFLRDALHVNDDSLPPLEEITRRYIHHVVAKTNGNKRQAASILGIARRTLYRHLEEDSSQQSR